MNPKPDKSALDTNSFYAIADLAYRESGLQLVIEKSSMIQSRLRHRLNASGFEDFQSYTTFVCSNNGLSERKQMISALTTNVSHFFRENHHFDILIDSVIPPLLSQIQAGGRFRVWSAGCSNGQEPYSIVMKVLENYPDFETLDFKVLATDIDPNVVNFAKSGVYPERLTTGIPKPMLSKYFDREDTNQDAVFTVKNILRSKIYFNELNLLGEWPMRNQVNVVFCRNVVIYFDQETQNNLWPRFRQILYPDGFLFLGHSERIPSPEAMGFLTDGPTTYRPVVRSTTR